MIRLRTLLTDIAAATVLLAVVVGIGFDGAHAAGVLAGGAMTVLNVAVLGWLVSRVVAAVADGRDAGLAAVGLGVKGVFVMGAWMVLASFFPPLAVTVGVMALVVALAGRSSWILLSAPAALPQES